MKSFPDFSLEKESGRGLVAGVDEAGRGPLCGPVVAGAVIFLNPDLLSAGKIKINDSKQMTHAAREDAYEFLTTHPDVIWAAALCTPTEIDEMNILHASLLAMKRAIDGLTRAPEFVLVDGNRLPDGITPALAAGVGSRGCGPGDGFNKIKTTNNYDSLAYEPTPRRAIPAPATPAARAGVNCEIPGLAVVHGDARSLSIAAASVIAKVSRDRIMCELAREFPQYGWDKNAGYPTAAHLQAIEKYGINKHYRKTYGPVKKIMDKPWPN